ncbi:MAG: SRPBCC family protein [Tetrasphaera sp.]
MSAFTITRVVAAPVDVVWGRLTDFARHGQAVPLTVTDLDPGPPGPGWQFVPRTGIGRARVADHMIVTIWSPPRPQRMRGRFRVVKIGPWLRGWAQVSVEEVAGGTLVTWTEELGPRIDPAPLLTRPLAARLGRRLFARALDRVLRP